MKRLAPTLVWLFLCSSAAAKPAVSESTASKAITPDIIDALAKEIDRSMQSLKLSGAVDPYFISYKVTEVEVNDVVASLGARTANRERHFVLLEAHVHVGSYESDNSNFVFPQRDFVDGIAQISLPLEASPQLARRSAWLVTDSAYKEALEQLRSKEDAIRSGAAPVAADIPSYTKQEPRVALDPVLVPALESGDHLIERAEKLSLLFEKHPHVRDSRVAITSFLERRWLLNSEGTRVHDTRRVTGIAMIASGQAEDGQGLARTFTRYGLTEADLPSDKELTKEAETLADELAALGKAPLAEAYTGPVLFEGEGAVGIARETLSRHLSGTPLPVGLSDSDSARFGGEFVGRLNLRVLSPLLSVVDDPTKSTHKGTRLIGGYKMDDEGTPSQRVEIIKNGKLKALLMSRTPSKGLTKSNGHARLSMPGGVFRGSATNLFITGKKAVSRRALVRKMLKIAKSEGLDHGMLIRQFDDPALTANTDLSRFRLFQLLNSLDRTAPPVALMAYKVLPNGKEQLVRGVQLKAVDVRSWRNVVGVSNKITVKNFLNSTDDPWVTRLAGGGQGFVPSSGIESAIATPDLLFERLDIKASAAGRRPSPIVAPPR